MTIGVDAIGLHAIGEMVIGSGAPLTYEPVSRILAGGFSNTRPAQLAELGVDIAWDNGDLIAWDNNDRMGWEA